MAVSEKLTELGATVINKKADSDRKLITAASPQASKHLGRLAAKTLLDHVEESVG